MNKQSSRAGKDGPQEEEDEEKDEGEDAGEDGQEEEGEESADDDMQLAWENLEVARQIYLSNQATHASELASELLSCPHNLAACA